MASTLTVLICTHNREQLLRRALDSINAAWRPAGCELLIVTNNCSDGTEEFLESYTTEADSRGWIPLRWQAERTPGKSHALNRALTLIRTDLVAFVDDDHRVAHDYLAEVVRQAEAFPEFGFFCGRILPDWDGSEPKWVHDTSPYRIFPLPVPRYEQGDRSFEIGLDGPLPGGGNQFARSRALLAVGRFSTSLGPHGHDLGGGEDIDFIKRALQRGIRLRYVPQVLQYHYVDLERLKLNYLLRKAYQRSRSVVRVHSRDRRVPAYMWRKLLQYAASAALSVFRPSRTRFYLVRAAATLGEVQGVHDRAALEIGKSRSVGVGAVAFGLAAAALLFAYLTDGDRLAETFKILLTTAAVSAMAVIGLTAKALLHFSQTGPELRSEVMRHFRGHAARSLLRLALWQWVIFAGLAGIGVLAYASLVSLQGRGTSVPAAAAAGSASLLVGVGLQFLRHLLHLPASIVTSSNFRWSRLYPLWGLLTPARIRALQWSALSVAVGPVAADAAMLSGRSLMPLLAFVSVVACFLLARRWIDPQDSLSSAAGEARKPRDHPNIVLIGSDTLRADRVGSSGHGRQLTPFIDELSSRGTIFRTCYTPCARTAPSLVSMFTGTWPHRHGVRDNFVAMDETALSVAALPAILADNGYRTATVSDWSGADFDKFPLGFQHADLPSDQWNIRYLIRQGPKDLRLFLSLFTHNRFGKRFLPELYYLAGVPLTHLIGRDARELISELSESGEPFLLNVFVSTTHPPFGSEYPYYMMYADPAYSGESRFAMARLTDPWEIIRRQGDSKKEFDLDHILNLYDGCVRNFDDEVKKICTHLERCGLRENTIIVIYSDHGMEFFEHETWGQGNSVRGEASPRVPLVIVDPRLPANGDCGGVVRTIDLAPTLLDLAGIGAVGEMDGASLAPYLRGEAHIPELAAFNETGIWLTDLPGMPEKHLRYPNLLELLDVPDKKAGTLAIKPEYRKIIVTAKDRMIRLGPWKLTYQPTHDGPIWALFNVEEDPLCRVDLAGRYPMVATALRRRLTQWIGGGALDKPSP